MGGVPFFIPPFFPSGSFFEAGFGKPLKGKQRKRYFPDYTSIIFGRKGKAPKGTLTGLEARPIPKGFKLEF